MKKTLYSIVWGKSTSDLSERVQKEYLAFGWKLAGGVAGGFVNGEERLYQAVYQEV